MKLKCNINGIEYEIVQGATFVENYNETLDSATIILKPTTIIKDVEQYDDVFVYTGEFNGYQPNQVHSGFYKHLLIDRIEEVAIRIEDDPKNTLYKYTLYLFSETKKLETIKMPSKSITEPLPIEKKKTAYQYLNEAVNLYSPVYKKAGANNTWTYVQKYTLDPNLIDVFGDIYCPDFTLDNPSLRDYLSKIMVIKDMIPYVKDDVIKAMDITERRGTFNADKNCVKYIAGQKSSEDFCTELRRNYYDALSENNSCKLTEFLGFRNKNNALLTFENLQLETRFPIYKINKFYMCYYKKVGYYTYNKYTNQTSNQQYKVFLCKQDITPLIKLNVERNALSNDWEEWLNNSDGLLLTIEQLSKYRFATIGYDIGSNTISGWGTKMTYYTDTDFPFWTKTSTYIQNIFEYMNRLYPVGIYDFQYLKELLNLGENDVITPISGTNEQIINDFGNYPLSLKGLFFQIEYNAFYDGAIITSKEDITRDDIVIADNPSSSLPILEKDGLAQQEKINRLGNKNIQLKARYVGVTENNYETILQSLGSVYDNGVDKDIIIYHREYSIWDTEIECNYVGSKDYVQKNFFTSVYAKHRPYALMSYGESIKRSENKKIYLLLSKDKQYFENLNHSNLLTFDFEPIKKILSFYKGTNIVTKNNNNTYFENDDIINYGFLECNTPIYNADGTIDTTAGNNGYTMKKFASDINVFASGNSLCFNLAMFENVSAGVYLDKDHLVPSVAITDANKDYVGSVQKWYLTTDDILTGFLEQIKFYVAHLTLSENHEIILNNTNEIHTRYNKIFALPKLPEENINLTNKIGGEYIINKDNKETVNMTMQIETIKDSDDIVYSSWLPRLSDLVCSFSKRNTNNIQAVGDENNDNYFKVYYGTIEDPVDQTDHNVTYPIIVLEFQTENLEEIRKQNFNFSCFFEDTDENIPSEYENNILIQFINNSNDNLMITNSIIRLNANTTVNGYINGSNYGTYTDSNRYIYFNKVEGNNNQMSMYYHTFILKEEDNGIVTSCVPSGKVWYIASLNQQTQDSNYTSNLIRVGSGSNQTWGYLNSKTWFAGGDNNTKVQIKKVLLPTKYYFETNIAISNLANYWQYYTQLVNYPQNIFVVASDSLMNKSIIYQEKSSIISANFSVDSAISFDEHNNLIVKATKVNGSTQFWYKDDYGAYHFIFGVNTYQEDVTLGYVKIYTSMISKKDLRVFDDNHRVVGKVKNIADSNNDRNAQKYENEDTNE